MYLVLCFLSTHTVDIAFVKWVVLFRMSRLKGDFPPHRPLEGTLQILPCVCVTVCLCACFIHTPGPRLMHLCEIFNLLYLWADTDAVPPPALILAGFIWNSTWSGRLGWDTHVRELSDIMSALLYLSLCLHLFSAASTPTTCTVTVTWPGSLIGSEPDEAWLPSPSACPLPTWGAWMSQMCRRRILSAVVSKQQHTMHLN